MAGAPAGEDPNVAFGKFLISRGVLTPDQVREAYQLLVGYRQQAPHVTLAQVLARHGIGDREALRAAHQAFGAASGVGSAAPPAAAPPTPPAAAPPTPGRFGYQTVELPPDERPDYGRGPGLPPVDTEGATLGPGRLGPPPAFGSEEVTMVGRPGFSEGATIVDRVRGPGATQTEGGPGSTHGYGSGPGSAHGYGGGPGGTAFGGGPGGTAFGGGPGGSAFGGGPGGTAFGGGPGGSAFGGGPGGSAFGGGPGGSAFGGGRPKVELPPAIPVDSDPEEEEDEDHEETGIESSTQGVRRRGKGKRRAAGGSPLVAQPKRVSMGLWLGIAVGCVALIGLVTGYALRQRALSEQKSAFLAAAEAGPAEDALAMGERLDEALLSDPEVSTALEELRQAVAVARARAAAEDLIAGLTGVSDLEERVEVCTAAIEADPTYARSYVERARARYALDKRKAAAGPSPIQLAAVAAPALEDLGEAMNRDPESPWPHYVRAMILLEDAANPRSEVRALKALQQVHELDPEGVLGYLAQGRIELVRNRPEEAIGLFDQAIETDRTLLDGYLARAEARIRRGDHAGARRDSDTAAKMDATSAQALALRGEARFLQNNDRVGALSDFDAALEGDPTSARALAWRGYARLERDAIGAVTSTPEDVEAAQRDAERALELDSRHGTAHLALALVHWRNKNLSRALVHATKAVDNATSEPAEAYLVRARLRVIEGDSDNAFDDLAKVREIDPNHARAMTTQASILLKRNAYGDALELVEQAIARDRGLAPAYFTRGYIHFRRKPQNRAQAFEDFSEAIVLMPQFPNAYFYRGAVHLDEGRFAEALRDLDKAEGLREEGKMAVQFTPAEVLLLKGDCYYGQASWSQALQAYNGFLGQVHGATPAVAHAKMRVAECRERLASGE